MNSRATLAALFAILINASVFASGAAVMLTADSGSLAAYVLPAAMAVSLFVSPVLGWVIAPSLISGKSGSWQRVNAAQPRPQGMNSGR